ncbi:CinA family nicotinamide mononucleotide deamidase-related protein [Shewanella sp. D64]|uniref:CinA family nicotinamide mononucleotide deamidase-related protein n=1 Tax=unclassified Shewanella TaxID=196818 RepID=UPI0022BA517A|nr:MULTISPECIES: CinA family nicotinamide mononucleotide deamidase-related protein [unclassified Shewanella]MEC4728466.1 CinA family nicotinamide mononucleotide deamidase-related protein [Shewanella sp. D64]MEC4740502.1 CinA family nicotinamide mononucleotide deamidase-related protein [Shewanella sp. E94]WBJ95167.1 CinA family nicotinamide mononucleotide deamidase-related protein [Shewanella sp. MTB7]
MKLEMICTGEEVLAGQIVDTNAAWFANALMEKGIECQRRITVGDRLEDLVAVFKERSTEADIIMVNGGLGPTSDDLSTEAMASAMGVSLVENKEWRSKLEAWFSKNGRVMAASNLKQALLPEGAVMIDNPVGTACGFAVKFNRAWLFFTPGVPFEFKRMVKEQFIPFVEDRFPLSDAVFVKKLLTLGNGESALADKLEVIPLPEGITLGYRSYMPYIEIKLFARGQLAIDSIPRIEARVKEILGNGVVAENITTLDQEIHNRLVNSGLTLSVAESCTGGMITSGLVAFAGSSAYLHQGLVTYSNEAKVKVLGVSPRTLDDHGAVSITTVEEMAKGARGILDSDYALATSGIAGPEGGSDEKPVGTVAIALATKSGVYSQMLKLPSRSRALVRTLSTAVAYDMLRRELLGEAVIVDYSSFSRFSK